MAEYNVAALVSGISPDISLPSGPRKNYFLAKLQSAEPQAQLAKLAEVFLVGKHLEALPPAEFVLHAEFLRHWADDNRDVLDNLLHLRNDLRMKPVMGQVREIVGRIGGRAERAAIAASKAYVAEQARLAALEGDDDEDEDLDAEVSAVAEDGPIDAEPLPAELLPPASMPPDRAPNLDGVPAP